MSPRLLLPLRLLLLPSLRRLLPLPLLLPLRLRLPLLLLLPPLLLFTFLLPASPLAAQEHTVMTWNIRREAPREGRDAWKRRR